MVYVLDLVVGLLQLLLDFISPGRLPLGPGRHHYRLYVLSGRRTAGLTVDRDRLMSARALAERLQAAGRTVEVVLCAYDEILEESARLMAQLFEASTAWHVVSDGRVGQVNTRVQLARLTSEVSSATGTEVAVVTDSWHRPRVLRYLKAFGRPEWSVCSDRLQLRPPAVVQEARKILRYAPQGDLLL